MGTFKNCTELNTVYPHGVKIGHPAYEAKHDRDNDGVACEQQGNESQAAPAPSTPKPSKSAVAEAGAGSDRLPQTGPGEVTAAGALVVVIGAVLIVAFRRRRTRFTT